jgi:secreted trypsin-like serine protease
VAVAVAAAAALTVATPASAMVGGTPVAFPRYPGAASVQTLAHGDPDWHFCGATVVKAPGQRTSRWAEINAHCVVGFDMSVIPAGLLHVRVGSVDRLHGGRVVGVDKVLPHASFDWGMGGNKVHDVAMLLLSKPVDVPAATIGTAHAGEFGAEIGWGLPDPAATGAAPARLAQLPARVAPAGGCADAGITDGELCIANNPKQGGPCYGDSGSGFYAWQQGRLVLAGIASRGSEAGTCRGGPMVYVDLASEASWMVTVVRTGTVPPPLPGEEPTPPQPAAAAARAGVLGWQEPVWAGHGMTQQ